MTGFSDERKAAEETAFDLARAELGEDEPISPRVSIRVDVEPYNSTGSMPKDVIAGEIGNYGDTESLVTEGAMRLDASLRVVSYPTDATDRSGTLYVVSFPVGLTSVRSPDAYNGFTEETLAAWDATRAAYTEANLQTHATVPFYVPQAVVSADDFETTTFFLAAMPGAVLAEIPHVEIARERAVFFFASWSGGEGPPHVAVVGRLVSP